jgi:hypothetical protein
MFLTKTEIDFLLHNREFTRDQQYYLKSRLVKKIKLLFETELPLIAKKGYLIPDYLATFSKDLAAGCKVSHSDNKLKVSQQGRGLAWEGNYPYCTIRSSIADARVTPLETKSGQTQGEEYEKMLRPGFEPGISDSKGRYA